MKIPKWLMGISIAFILGVILFRLFMLYNSILVGMDIGDDFFTGALFGGIAVLIFANVIPLIVLLGLVRKK